MPYKSKHYTCEEIDQRLLQGYYDDAVQRGYSGTKEDFIDMVLTIVNKVDKVPGKVLTTNDFTNELKEKLDTLLSITTIGSGLSLSDGQLSVTIDTNLYVIVEELPEEPAAGNENKLHLVLDTESEEEANSYIEYLFNYDTLEWEEIGKSQVTVDLTPYLRKDELRVVITNGSLQLLKGNDAVFTLNFTSRFTKFTDGNSLTVDLGDVLPSAVNSGMYKISIDSYGRVTGHSLINKNDLVSLGLIDQDALDEAIAGNRKNLLVLDTNISATTANTYTKAVWDITNGTHRWFSSFENHGYEMRYVHIYENSDSQIVYKVSVWDTQNRLSWSVEKELSSIDGVKRYIRDFENAANTLILVFNEANHNSHGIESPCFYIPDNWTAILLANVSKYKVAVRLPNGQAWYEQNIGTLTKCSDATKNGVPYEDLAINSSFKNFIFKKVFNTDFSIRYNATIGGSSTVIGTYGDPKVNPGSMYDASWIFFQDSTSTYIIDIFITDSPGINVDDLVNYFEFYSRNSGDGDTLEFKKLNDKGHMRFCLIPGINNINRLSMVIGLIYSVTVNMKIYIERIKPNPAPSIEE